MQAEHALFIGKIKNMMWNHDWLRNQEIVQVEHATLFQVPVVLDHVLVQRALIVVPPVARAPVLPGLQVNLLHVSFHVTRLFYPRSADSAPQELIIHLLNLSPHESICINKISEAVAI